MSPRAFLARITMSKAAVETISGESLSRVVGAVVGLAGFATAVLAGMATGNPGTVTLGRALLCLIIGVVVGRILGWGGEIASKEFLERYREEHPEPEPPAALVRLKQKRDRHELIVEEMKKSA
jgi:membrane protein DedA with SNARE-associated domain